MSAARRLQKELLKIQEHLPPGVSLASAENFELWYMDIKVLDDNPLYRDQTYRLKFLFSSSYPIGMSPALESPFHITPVFLSAPFIAC